MILIRDLRLEDLDLLKFLLDDLNNTLELKHKINEKTINSVYLEMDKYPEIYSNQVAIENNKIIGFVSLIFYKSFLHTEGTALINELIVAKSHRNKGVGKNLVQKAIEMAKKRRMDEIEVGTELANTLAQKFYKKVGFNEEFMLLGKLLES